MAGGEECRKEFWKRGIGRITKGVASKNERKDGREEKGGLGRA